MGDTAVIGFQDFILLELTVKQLGLEMKRDECEHVGHSDDMRSLFASHGINLSKTRPAQVIILGAPRSAGPHLDAALEGKRQEWQRCQSD